MNHTEFAELYELYVLGALEPEIAAEIDRHLAEGCEHCRAEVDRAMALTASLAELAPARVPPARLRERVLSAALSAPTSSVTAMPPSRERRSIVLALSLACAALLLLAIGLGYRNGELRGELAASDRNRVALESALKNLSRSETRTVQFGRADQPHGRVFASPATGVVFVASSLPQLAANRTFQLWVIPPSGGPRSAGTFRADSNGSTVQVSPVNVEPGSKAVAVSIEPLGGSPAPTATPVIVVPLG